MVVNCEYSLDVRSSHARRWTSTGSQSATVDTISMDGADRQHHGGRSASLRGQRLKAETRRKSPSWPLRQMSDWLPVSAAAATLLAWAALAMVACSDKYISYSCRNTEVLAAAAADTRNCDPTTDRRCPEVYFDFCCWWHWRCCPATPL